MDFVTNDTPPTLTIISTSSISDYNLTPKANMIYSLRFEWGLLNYNNGTYEYVWRLTCSEYPRIVE